MLKSVFVVVARLIVGHRKRHIQLFIYSQPLSCVLIGMRVKVIGSKLLCVSVFGFFVATKVDIVNLNTDLPVVRF